jgi:hypothetical protein
MLCKWRRSPATDPATSCTTPSACFPGKDERIAAALAHVATLWGAPDDAQWARSLEIRNQFLAALASSHRRAGGTLTAA